MYFTSGVGWHLVATCGSGWLPSSMSLENAAPNISNYMRSWQIYWNIRKQKHKNIREIRKTRRPQKYLLEFSAKYPSPSIVVGRRKKATTGEQV